MSKKILDNSTRKGKKDKEKSADIRLFTAADAKSADLSDNGTNEETFSSVSKLINGKAVPVGVVGTDESLVLPSSKSSNLTSNETKSKLNTRANDKEPTRFPPINKTNQSLYEQHYNPLLHHYHGYEQHAESRNRHHHHHYHHHLQYCHRHRHKRNERDYDPRWWYMPVNAVHGPRLRVSMDYKYRTPKWYELPGKI